MPGHTPHDSRIHILSAVNALLGAWLVLAPRIIGAPSRQLAASGFVVGLCVLLLSVTRFLRRHTAVMSWAIVVLGAWTIMSPFVLHRLTGDLRIWNYVIAGALMATIEAVSLTSTAAQGSWVQRGG